MLDAFNNFHQLDCKYIPIIYPRKKGIQVGQLHGQIAKSIYKFGIPRLM